MRKYSDEFKLTAVRLSLQPGLQVIAEYEAAPRQELEDVMPRLQDLALELLAAADHVAHRSSASLGMRTATSSPAR